MSDLNNCLSGNELIIGLKEDIIVNKFWSWAYSDILSNRNRSIFSEFLVAIALDSTNHPRKEWDSVDIKYKNCGIEVKASAYLQNWYQKSLSTIRFDISKKKAWIAETNTLLEIPERSSDCFVFCLYTEKSKENCNIIDVNKWEFYALPTNKINKIFGNQKSVSLSKVQNLCKPLMYKNLKTEIDLVLANLSNYSNNELIKSL